MKVAQLPASDFEHYLKNYLQKVPDLTLLKSLEYSRDLVKNLYQGMSPEKALYTYADDKWTPKEMLLNLIDSERIFCTRALRFARKDETVLSGYNHEAFVEESLANERSLSSLLEEYNAQRQSSIFLFKSFTQEMLQRKGNANGLVVSVAAVGLVISGHELHHVQILKDRYL
ncbi:DinB family protein [Mesonia sp.]|uniref:DinB family protein n=1 Tax=Mesonia sp. TaxID=1960830 RepID=UPI003F9CEC3A